MSSFPHSCGKDGRQVKPSPLFLQLSSIELCAGENVEPQKTTAIEEWMPYEDLPLHRLSVRLQVGHCQRRMGGMGKNKEAQQQDHLLLRFIFSGDYLFSEPFRETKNWMR